MFILWRGSTPAFSKLGATGPSHPPSAATAQVLPKQAKFATVCLHTNLLQYVYICMCKRNKEICSYNHTCRYVHKLYKMTKLTCMVEEERFFFESVSKKQDLFPKDN